MKKKTMTVLLIILSLMMSLPAASAETREGVIWLEGQEEAIEETLFRSRLGFSLWYANDALDVYEGDEYDLEGVVVEALYIGDHMVLDMIPEEDARDYTEDSDPAFVELAAEGRAQTDVYWVLENGRYYFLTLIGENGQYLRAIGEYFEESAEGNGKYLQRVLDSITFSAPCLIRAEWSEEEADNQFESLVILTAQEPVTDVVLLRLSWDGDEVTWEESKYLGSLGAQEPVTVTVEFDFIDGILPSNGIMYTDEAGNVRAFALDFFVYASNMVFWDLEEGITRQ